MPVRLSNLKSDTREVDIPVGDEVLHVTYRPGRLTPNTIDQLQTAQRTNDNTLAVKALARALSDVLTSWDLLDDNEQPYPIGRASIGDLGIELLGIVWTGINEDAHPNPSSAATSGAG